MSSKKTNHSADRNNNFGLLRLLFAVFVIFGHSPELVDGNRSREFLTDTFGGRMSLGDLAVFGFFLISGYLITQSFNNSNSIRSYFLKRFLRIIPGYLVSFWICIIIVAPLGGATASIFSWKTLGHQLFLSLLLLPPDSDGGFASLPYPFLNGSMWTIGYEFRCYIFTAMIGILGIYRTHYRFAFLTLVVSCVILVGAGFTLDDHLLHSHTLTMSVYFTAAYGTGALYYLYRDKYSLNNIGAMMSIAILCELLYSSVSEVAFIIVGGYLIFWFAFKVPTVAFSRAANNFDVSYGIYLYAWPVQNLIIWNYRDVNPLILSFFTLAITGVLGAASWKLIEKPSLNLSKIIHSNSTVAPSIP